MRYASWTSRVMGLVIDCLISMSPLLLFFTLSHAFPDAALGRLARFTGSGLLLCQLLILLLTVYNRHIRAGRTGQSWGRQIARTRLVDADSGNPVGTVPALLHDLAHVVDGVLGGIGFLWPLIDSREQTFADKLMKTVVIRASSPAPGA